MSRIDAIGLGRSSRAAVWVAMGLQIPCEAMGLGQSVPFTAVR